MATWYLRAGEAPCQLDHVIVRAALLLKVGQHVAVLADHLGHLEVLDHLLVQQTVDTSNGSSAGSLLTPAMLPCRYPGD